MEIHRRAVFVGIGDWGLGIGDWGLGIGGDGESDKGNCEGCMTKQNQNNNHNTSKQN